MGTKLRRWLEATRTVPQCVEDDRQRRHELQQCENPLAAALRMMLGDPPPGRSALDLRNDDEQKNIR
jgi:hypothetical protein